MKTIGSFLVAMALVVAMVSCTDGVDDSDGNGNGNEAVSYQLAVSSTEGGEVTSPGKGTWTYQAGVVVDLAAEAEEGYRFVSWKGDVQAVADASTASTTVTMDGNYVIVADFAEEEPEQGGIRGMFSEGSLQTLVLNDEAAPISGHWRYEFAWQPNIYGLVYLVVSMSDGVEVRFDSARNSRCGYGTSDFSYAGEMALVSGDLEVLGLESTTPPHRTGPTVFVYALGCYEGREFRAGIYSWSEETEAVFTEYRNLPREETEGLIEQLVDQASTQVVGDVEEFVRRSA